MVLKLVALRVDILKNFAFVSLRVETVVNRLLYSMVFLDELFVQDSIEIANFVFTWFLVRFLGGDVP